MVLPSFELNVNKTTPQMFFCILLSIMSGKFIPVVEYVPVHSFLWPTVLNGIGMPQFIYPFCFCVSFLFLATPYVESYLSPLTRDWFRALCIKQCRILTTRLPGKSLSILLLTFIQFEPNTNTISIHDTGQISRSETVGIRVCVYSIGHPANFLPHDHSNLPIINVWKLPLALHPHQ